MSSFNESDHPRDDDGKFGSGGGASPQGVRVSTTRTNGYSTKVSVGNNGELSISRPYTSDPNLRNKVQDAVLDHFTPKLPQNTFYRFANSKEEFELAKNGELRNSRNHAENFEEKGLSVAEGAHYSTQGYKYGYLVEGEPVGYGSDGEPLLDPKKLKVVSKLKSSSEIKKEDLAARESLLKDQGWTLEMLRDIANGKFDLNGEQVKSDSVGKPMNAAGIALLSDGCVLLLKRGNGGDHAGEWCFPGGKVEEGEFVEDAACRETLEETGYLVKGAVRRIGHNENGETNFATYAKNVARFEPVLCDEHTESMWAPLDALPEPMHPGTLLTLESGALDQINPAKLTETDVARLIAGGELDSPQRVGNMHLFAMRVTGTGTTYRSADDQFVYRPPEHYLNDEFLARCNGLMVIYEHPEKKTLNSEEFADRVIGSIMLPYINGDEVWGIAKIYDDEAVEIMLSQQMSTSPTVVFRNLSDNSTIKLDNGEALLIEGKPSLLDHLAVCSLGVWDKGGDPAGVLNSTNGAIDMTPEEMKAKADEFEAKAKADAEKIAELQAKADALEAAMPAAMQTAADKAKADAEEEEKKAKEKADADEEEAKKAKADSVAVQARIADMEARLPKILSDADVAKIADTQAKADGVCRAFGDSAPAPIAGESVLGYRKRMIGKFKDHSPAWKSVPMDAISDAVIDIVEGQVYADAMTAARSPSLDIGAGLREVVSKSRAGHEISTFVGKISDFTSQFKSPVRKFVTQFNKPAA